MKNEFYKCEICGRIISVIESGQGPIVCCGEDMKKLIPNTVDAAHEKHIPVIEKTKDGFLVKIGSEPHPMIPEHYIMWIEIQAEGETQRKELQAGDLPQKNFVTKAREISVFAYCNLHGLWTADFK